MIDVSIAVALGAGLLSFLSPCVLPLLPGYLSFISGAGSDEIKAGSRRAGVFYRTLFFVFGFSAVFVGLGLAFSGGGMLVAGRSSRLVTIIAGSIITLFGLNTVFNFVQFFNTELKAHVRVKPRNAAGAFVVGMAFGAGWTPCVGPILASILLLAARSGGAAKAVMLLSAYSLGLALPFLAAGLFFERLSPVWAWFKRHGLAVRIVSGILLIVIGLSMALGRLTAINAIFFRAGIALKAMLASRPQEAKAWTLGILAALVTIVSLVPIISRRPFVRPFRIVALAVLALALVLELTGLLSMAGLVSDWFLFQGV